MNIINAISHWHQTRQEKKLADMKEKGICPDCVGRGFNMPVNDYYIFTQHYDCPGCNGSGSYEDWEKI